MIMDLTKASEMTVFESQRNCSSRVDDYNGHLNVGYYVVELIMLPMRFLIGSK
jgi:hypothetical protein